MSGIPFFVLVLVGAFVGFRMAGVVGLVLSVLVAIVMNPSFGKKLNRNKTINKIRRHSLSPADRTFFETTFAMFAKLARVDGNVNRSEIQALEKIMKQVFSLGTVGRGIAISVFNEARHDTTDFRQHAFAFNKLYEKRPVVLGAMLESMFVVSVADGSLHESEEQLLQSAASIFEIEERVYFSLHRRYVSGAESSNQRKPETVSHTGAFMEACNRLGCKESDSVEDIKTKYRKLVQEHHPDKLAGKGLPEGFENFANERFREIQEAFEVIKDEKGFS
jgi:DnaJ like chaperone protein